MTPTGDSPAAGSTALLSVDEIRAAYDETVVLRDVSLAVDRGEVVSLIGRNGAGKTTTLRSIMGNLIPLEGTVRFDGQDVTTLPSTEKVGLGIALVPEERRIFHDLSVAENLQLAEIGGRDVEAAWSLAEIFDLFENLDERRDQPGSALSGGEQQMLAIARALVSGAEFVMLDEPTEGLAPLIVERVEELIVDLNEQGITVLLVEQNAQAAMNVADRHYILNKGQVVYEGTTADLEADDDVRQRYLGVSG